MATPCRVACADVWPAGIVQSMNPGQDPRTLRIGQSLTVPCQGGGGSNSNLGGTCR